MQDLTHGVVGGTGPSKCTWSPWNSVWPAGDPTDVTRHYLPVGYYAGHLQGLGAVQ